MKLSFLPILSLATVCALLGATGFAQAPATPAPGATPATPAPKPKPMAPGDALYVKNASKSLTFLAQLVDAAKALTDEKQTRLRDTTAKDVASVNKALNKFLEARGEKGVTDVTGSEKTELDRVNRAFAAKPDKNSPDKPYKEWVAALAKETKRLDHETEVAGKSAQDPDLKTFISNYGPTMRSTFTSAESAEKAAMAKKTK